MEKADDGGRQFCLGEELNLKKLIWPLHMQKAAVISVVLAVDCYGNKKG